MKHQIRSKISSSIINCIMIVLSIIILYPFIYCLSYSFSNSTAVMTKNVTLLPVQFTLENYKGVFSNKIIYISSLVSIFRTVAGTLWTIVVTSLAAYGIAKKDMPGRKTINLFLIIPIYFSGGLIPFYVLIHGMHLFNNLLVYVLPNGFFALNMLMMTTYFETIHPALEESAVIDGAGYFKVFIRIIFPLSMPVISVVAMYTAVWQWNSWYDAVLFITNRNLLPLQKILQDLLQESSISTSKLISGGASSLGQRHVSPESFRMATLIITTVPIVIVYPFFQKHFVHGIMIGAVKE